MSAKLRTYGTRVLTTIGFVTVAGYGVKLAVGKSIRKRSFENATNLPEAFILDVNFENIRLVEKEPPPWSQVGSSVRQVPLRRLVQMLEEAAGDERVKGVYARFGANQSFGGLAQVQEIRDAVTSYREKTGGRALSVAYAHSFGEAASGGSAPYFLASAFEKVYMQPSGLLKINGFAVTTPFLRRLLDRFNIKTANLFRREGYKNAINQFTHAGYSAEHREATEAIVNGFVDQITAGVAEKRQLTQQQVMDAVDAAPLTAEEAVRLKLIDGSRYEDQARESLPKNDGGPDTDGAALPRVSAGRYMRASKAIKARDKGKTDGREAGVREVFAAWGKSDPEFSAEKPPSKSGKPVVALITASGPIVAEKTQGPTPLGGSGEQIVAGELSSALRKARSDGDVKAVVLRIDSPGGSANASDTIYREVQRLREAGKPVVACMGNLAASGGYFIACDATKIVAQPSTLTGSIGVIAGKFNFDGPLREYGIDNETIACGKNADAFSPFTDFTPQQVEQANRLIDNIYTDFKAKVARSRKKTEAEVSELAKGRVWLGSSALKLGLVDQLGGEREAIRLAKLEAGLPTEDPSAVEVVEFPRPLPVLAQLLKALSSQGLPEEDLQQQTYGLPLGQILAAASLISQISAFARQPAVQHAIEEMGALQQQQGLELRASTSALPRVS